MDSRKCTEFPNVLNCMPCKILRVRQVEQTIFMVIQKTVHGLYWLFHILYNIRSRWMIYESNDASTNNKLYVPVGKRNVVYLLHSNCNKKQQRK